MTSHEQDLACSSAYDAKRLALHIIARRHGTIIELDCLTPLLLHKWAVSPRQPNRCDDLWRRIAVGHYFRTAGRAG